MNGPAPTPRNPAAGDADSPRVRWHGPRGWRGRAAPDCRDFDFTAIPWARLRRQGMAESDGSLRCVKRTRTRQVMRVADARTFGAAMDRPVYVKRYLIDTMRRRVGNLLTRGKGRAEHELGRRLLGRGLPTPTPLAWALAGPLAMLGPVDRDSDAAPASFLLTLEMENQGTAQDFIDSGRAGREPEFFRSLAGFMAGMHDRGFYHDDCLAKNFCVAPGADFAPGRGAPDPLAAFQIHDIDHGRLYRKGVPWRIRVENLSRMLASMTESGKTGPDTRRLFLRSYLDAARAGPDRGRDPLVRRLEALAEGAIGSE